MEAFERKEVPDMLSFESPYRATGVSGAIISQYESSGDISQLARYFLAQRIASIGPESADAIESSYEWNKTRNVVRIILPVAVHHDADIARRRS